MCKINGFATFTAESAREAVQAGNCMRTNIQQKMLRLQQCCIGTKPSTDPVVLQKTIYLTECKAHEGC